MDKPAVALQAAALRGTDFCKISTLEPLTDLTFRVCLDAVRWARLYPHGQTLRAGMGTAGWAKPVRTPSVSFADSSLGEGAGVRRAGWAR